MIGTPSETLREGLVLSPEQRGMVEDYNKKPFVGYFKLLAGSHCEGYDANGKQIIYQQGDVIHSKSNLAALNPPGNDLKHKFMKLDGPPAAAPLSAHEREIRSVQATAKTEDALDAMTVDELKRHAVAEEIDLGGAKTKAEIIAAIRAST